MKTEKLSIEFSTDQSLIFTSIGAAGVIAEQSYPPGSYTCTGPILRLDQNTGLRTDGGLAVEGVALEIHRTGRHVVVKTSSSAAGIMVAPAGMIVLPIPVVGYITSYTRFEVEGP